ncbi:hypothetical protein SEA_LILYPAD_29 [Gordonia phage LilyPad]|nr:hypothetical protein SEA_LILYPAD_29 [Gordonia phage LilyPad]
MTKVWNGSAFVDPVGYKFWNGSAYAEPKAISVWDGSSYKKIWPTFRPQRMNKSGNMLAPWNATGTPVIITGWASDIGEPATIVDDKLVIQGALPNGSVVVTYAFSNTDFNGSTMRTALWRNGVQVAYREDGYSNGVTSQDLSLAYHGPLAAGDTFELRGFRGYGNTGTFLAARTFTRASEPVVLPQRLLKSTKIDRSASASVFDPVTD